MRLLIVLLGTVLLTVAGATHIDAQQPATPKDPLGLYPKYSPPNHPDGTVHKTKTEAEATEAAERHLSRSVNFYRSCESLSRA
jgi:hypothetical protein